MRELSPIALNGCDTFMLAMDRSMRRAGSPGNICHLLVTLPVDSDINAQRLRLLDHPTFQAVTRLRLSQSLFRAPRWISRDTATSELAISDSCRTERDLHTLVLAHSLDIKAESPFGVVLVPHYERGPSLLFYWHHALCDAHGAELLVSALATDTAGSLALSDERSVSVKDRIIQARKTARMIFSKARGTIARLHPSEPNAPTPQFSKLIFSAAQTKCADQTVQRLTGGMFPTAAYLAVTSRAVAAATTIGRSENDPLFVPVPHDIRRSSKQRSPLSNQISVAFFRITSPLTSSLMECTNAIIQQLHDTIAEGYQHGMVNFLHLIRRVPLSLLWRIIEQPTKGHPASFYFSDIGASLSNLAVFGGLPVVYATHYPPVLSPPGFTTVWSRYRESLEVTICFDTKTVDEATLARFANHLAAELTDGTHAA